MADYKKKLIDLNGSMSLIHALKKAGFTLQKPFLGYDGKYPKYGRLHLVITSRKELYRYKRFYAEWGNEPIKSKKKSEYQLWTERLARLTDISIEEAQQIADEKLEYKDHQVFELNSRNALTPSLQREKLIKKLKRSNPLRYIRDKDHAFAILAASNRHNNSDYEAQLRIAKEKVVMGEIDPDEVQDYARSNCHYRT